MPTIKLTKELAYDFGYKFDECKMSETAGGMLLSVDQDYANEFSERLANKYKTPNWIVGSIDNIKKPQYVRIAEDVEHIEIINL